jgi:hypothetical protein
LEKETHTLTVAEKVLTDSRDTHEKQKNERKGSLLRAEVRLGGPPPRGGGGREVRIPPPPPDSCRSTLIALIIRTFSTR